MSLQGRFISVCMSLVLAIGLCPLPAVADEGEITAASVVERGLSPQASTGSRSMYRLYNPNSGEHFYTASGKERSNLIDIGWKYEGIGWIAPVKSGAPVYRLYSGTDHHYTMNAKECNGLKRAGWKYEGIGWYSDEAKGAPLYRQFNPNVNPKARRNNSGSHNYTLNRAENDQLVKVGWKAEGIGWHAVKGSHSGYLYAAQRANFSNRLNSIVTTYDRDSRITSSGSGILVSATNEYVAQLDTLMNEVIEFLEAAPEVDHASVSASQNSWRSDLNKAYEEAGRMYGGGTLVIYADCTIAYQYRASRVEELIQQIP